MSSTARKVPGRRQAGLSMVEMIISLAIAALLIAGMTQVFLGTRASHEMHNSLSRAQESTRFAHMFLSRELRQAGALGCLSATTDPVVHLAVAPDDLLYGHFGSAGVHGFASPGDVPTDVTDEMALRGAGGAPAEDDSEVLLVRGAPLGPGVTTNDDEERQSADEAVNVFVDNGPDLERINEGDIIAITDCVRGVVVQVADTNLQTGNINFRDGNTLNDFTGTTPFPDGMEANADVVAITPRAYYVAPNPDGEPALYRRRANGNAEEMVAGVERLAFEYLVGDDYEFADDVADWRNVEAVRVTAIVSDERPGLRDGDEAEVIPFPGGDLEFDDGRIRLVLSTTAGLRN